MIIDNDNNKDNDNDNENNNNSNNNYVLLKMFSFIVVTVIIWTKDSLNTLHPFPPTCKGINLREKEVIDCIKLN